MPTGPRDLQGRPGHFDAIGAKLLEQLEKRVGGHDVADPIGGDVEGDGDSAKPSLLVHSAVTSATAARAEDSSTMALPAA